MHPANPNWNQGIAILIPAGAGEDTDSAIRASPAPGSLLSHSGDGNA